MHELTKRIKYKLHFQYLNDEIEGVISQWAKERAEWLKDRTIKSNYQSVIPTYVVESNINQAFQIEETIEEMVIKTCYNGLGLIITENDAKEIIQAVREFDKERK